MQPTEIAWTDSSWNPTRGCRRVSPGCEHCYAELMAARFSKPGMWGHGFAQMTKAGPRWTGKVALVPEKLNEPLRLRERRRIFVNSTSDLFHEALPDEAIAAVFGIMAAAPRHTFQVLTKRPERMRSWFKWASTRPPHAMVEHALDVDPLAVPAFDRFFGEDTEPSEVIGDTWPLQNVWLGVSVEDQRSADERIPLLLQTPAAVRFVSYEPALGPVDFHFRCVLHPKRCDQHRDFHDRHPLDWVIVGGESGPGARPCDVAWMRSVVEQCREAGVACFVKQLGARPISDSDDDRRHCGDMNLPHPFRMILHSAKGGDPAEWPEDLRVREMPK